MATTDAFMLICLNVDKAFVHIRPALQLQSCFSFILVLKGFIFRSPPGVKITKPCPDALARYLRDAVLYLKESLWLLIL